MAGRYSLGVFSLLANDVGHLFIYQMQSLPGCKAFLRSFASRSDWIIFIITKSGKSVYILDTGSLQDSLLDKLSPSLL